MQKQAYHLEKSSALPEAAPTVNISGAEAICKCLLNEGVDTIFGVPGESYLPVLDALYGTRESIQLITTRHESGAANMAEADGKLTGCLSTSC